MKAKKSLGQHFLTRPALAERVVAVANIERDDSVLEVGPGKGIVTRELLKAGARVVAVEKDAELAEFLEEKFREEIASGTLRIVRADILRFDVRALYPSGYTLVANLPFYITGNFLRKFLGGECQPSKMILIVQREVAERIANPDARGGRGKHSILSISVNAYGTPKIIRHIAPGNFSPPPQVQSSLLEITNISKDFFRDVDEDKFFTLVRAGFAHKRKLLASNLHGLVTAEQMKACGVPDKARAEDIPKEVWKCLAKRI